MVNRFQDVVSLQEFKSKLVYSDQDPNIQLVPGLEEFIEYVIANGNDRQKFAIGWEQPHDCKPFAGHPAPGTVKTLVYALPDSTLLLCMLNMDRYLNEEKVAQLYTLDNKLTKASPDDLRHLGMVPGACHGFLSSEIERDWRIVTDEGLLRHPIYEAETFRKCGALFAATKYYTEIMQARFPERVVIGNISKE